MSYALVELFAFCHASSVFPGAQNLPRRRSMQEVLSGFQDLHVGR